jgi:hypothetical protein
MIVWAEHLHVQRVAVVPPVWGNRATAVAGKVDDDGIAWEDGGIVDEVRHECILNGGFRGPAIQEHADTVARNMEIVHEPAPHFERVIDTGRQIPDLAGFVLVDPDNEGENRGHHPTETPSSSINAYFEVLHERLTVDWWEKGGWVEMRWRCEQACPVF